MKSFIKVLGGPMIARPGTRLEETLIPVEDVTEIAPACCGYHFEIRTKTGKTYRGRYKLVFVFEE